MILLQRLPIATLSPSVNKGLLRHLAANPVLGNPSLPSFLAFTKAAE